MSYPPETSRSCHEADGRSDRSGGSGGATSSSGGVYGTLCSNFGGKWPTQAPSREQPGSDLSSHQTTTSSTTVSQHDRLVSNWKKWSLGLDYLLQDSEGVALFKTYLQYEGCSNLLDFWFACQGFRSKVDPTDHRKITQLIKVIYRTYIRGSGIGTVGMTNVPLPVKTTLEETQPSSNVLQARSEPIRLRAETKRMISERISRKHSLDQSVFDPAQIEVEHFLRTTAYPAFLKSDVYIDFLQSAIDGSTYKYSPVQDASSRSASVPWPAISGSSQATMGFSGGMTSHPPTGKFLPTLEEDRELRSDDLPRYLAQPSCTQPGQTNLNSGPAPSPCIAQHVQLQLHCSHCLQYHSQGHPVCPAVNDQANAWVTHIPHQLPVGMRPPFGSMSSSLQSTAATTTSSAAPLTTENIQMTRFYRAEFPLQLQQQQASHNPVTGSNLMRSTPQSIDPFGRRPYPLGPCDVSTGVPRLNTSHVQTHWMDALCPTSAPQTDLRGSTRLPSQPPNPYHISYAPVSARDSERHSLSSEARTDDTHSHTDSSHDGAPTRLWQCSFGQRYPGQLSKPSIPQTLLVPSSSGDVSASTDASSYNRLGHTPTAFTERSCVGPGASQMAFLSPKPGDDFIHGTRSYRCNTTTAGDAFYSSETSGEPVKLHGKHQRRALRRSGWRSGDRGRGTTGTGNPSGMSGDVLASATGGAASKSATRSHNLAERDPRAFFRILSEKLQRVLENQIATERLDLLMSEGSPNADQSANEAINLSESLRSPKFNDQLRPSSVSETGDRTVTTTTTTTATAEITKSQSVVTASSLLQRPWADRLLAAARVQHESTRDNAQAILEDHCSRIWAASADRTPNSSDSSGGGAGGRNSGDLFNRLAQSTASHMLPSRSMPIESAFEFPGKQDLQRGLASPRFTDPRSDGVGRTEQNQQYDNVCTPATQTDEIVHSSERAATAFSGTKSDLDAELVAKANLKAGNSPDFAASTSSTSSSSSSSSGKLHLNRASKIAELDALLNLSFTPGDHVSILEPSRTVISPTVSHSLVVHSSNDTATAHQPHPPPATTTVSTTQHSTSSSITSAISTSTPGFPTSSPSSNSPNTLVIGYYLGDDPVPYRSLWPSSEITLGQFKQLIPKKKGSFRYFFKKFSNEFGSGVVHQEITNDNCLLPLWEGKVVAKVERIE